jgi:hypothetical protein
MITRAANTMAMTDAGMETSSRMMVQVGFVPKCSSNHIPPKTAPSRMITVKQPTDPVMLIRAVLKSSFRDLGVCLSDRLTLPDYNRYLLKSNRQEESSLSNPRTGQTQPACQTR